jgi:hypothetical protein
VTSCEYVEVPYFEIVIKTRASCLLQQADTHKESALLLFKLEELITALVIRNDYLTLTGAKKRKR